jgi:cytochrome P450
MSDGVRTPVIDFDHNSPEHSKDPVASYATVRKAAPVAWTEAWGGYWVLAGYDAVFDAARDDDLFSSARLPYGGDGQSITIPKRPMHLHLPIELDPPESQKYRSIMNKLITPNRVKELLPMIQRYISMFIDEIIEKGEADFATLTGVPAIVTITWLGLPLEDWRLHARAHRQVLSTEVGSEEFNQAVNVDLPYLTEQVRRTIAERAEAPGDDPISFILAQEVDGRPITQEEAFSMVELLISGGVGTTAALTSQALVWLSEHPDVRREIIDDPELMQSAIEEFLRVFSPTQALARTITRDVDFHGATLKAGDRALLVWGSANRDGGDVGDTPDEVDIRRTPNRHLAFGVGSHRCAGSHLARPMARMIISEILTRMPDYKVDTAAARRYARQGINTGYDYVPTTFTPGPRVIEERL